MRTFLFHRVLKRVEYRFIHGESDQEDHLRILVSERIVLNTFFSLSLQSLEIKLGVGLEVQ